MKQDDKNLEDPQYVPFEDTFETQQHLSEMSKKAREPKTPLQVEFLSIIPSRKRFKSTAEHNRFKKLETKCAPDEDGRVYRAWIKAMIAWGKNVNKKRKMIVINIPKLFTAIENDESYLDWDIENRLKVLRKPSAAQLADQLGNDVFTQGQEDI